MSAEAIAAPNPMWESAEDAGFSEFAGYNWRKAQGTLCASCDLPIEGRRYEISFDAGTWRHVACVTPELWHCNLGQPRSNVAANSWCGTPKPKTIDGETT